VQESFFIVWNGVFLFFHLLYTVKPAQSVTSIKQSPVFKGYLVLSCHKMS
jgi:hypothetical protein